MSENDTPWGGPADVHARLIGTWTFERTVSNYGTATGVAVFEPIDGEWLAYHEDAEVLLLDGKEMKAKREYLIGGRPDGFNVFFKENPPRLFQQVALKPSEGRMQSSSQHQCRLDLYSSDYEFHPDGRLVIRHTAKGPQKDYTMVTTYRRRDKTR
jgi:hypothetical protein